MKSESLLSEKIKKKNIKKCCLLKIVSSMPTLNQIWMLLIMNLVRLLQIASLGELFSRKSKKSISKCCLLKILPSMPGVKSTMVVSDYGSS